HAEEHDSRRSGEFSEVKLVPGPGVIQRIVNVGNRGGEFQTVGGIPQARGCLEQFFRRIIFWHAGSIPNSERNGILFEKQAATGALSRIFPFLDPMPGGHRASWFKFHPPEAADALVRQTIESRLKRRRSHDSLILHVERVAPKATWETQLARLIRNAQ